MPGFDRGTDASDCTGSVVSTAVDVPLSVLALSESPPDRFRQPVKRVRRMPPSATFEARSDTWIVMPSGSRHTPTVAGGSMLILYWIPDGAVEWG